MGSSKIEIVVTLQEDLMPSMKRKPEEFSEIFNIINFYMGQGDCSLIRCPDGKIVMIDCGNNGIDFQDDFKAIVADQVRDPGWAGNEGKIDALILTHKDADHYNQVGWILGDSILKDKKYEPLTIDKIYFSWAYGDNSPLGRYQENGLNDRVCDGFFKTSDLYEVTIREGESFYKQWNKDDFKKLVLTAEGKAEWPIDDQKLTLFSGKTTSEGKDWSVSLIAGNVMLKKGTIDILGKNENDGLFKEKSTEDNSRSLITLLEIENQKALFCGDATFSTEEFLVSSQSSLIGDVQFVLVPHHGSELASSSVFVKTVNPKQAVVSTAYLERKHRHPRYTALERWLDKMQTDATSAHDIDYWEWDLTLAQTTLNDWIANSLVLDQSDSGEFKWLKNLSQTNVYFGVKLSAGSLLYREAVTVDLWETALYPSPQKFLNFHIG